uniref:Bromo domain-containing protein n=1 Tax=Heterorhabditis bacteriophora TaxID=37862 RepID=A0A1I7WXJ5_HETBA
MMRSRDDDDESTLKILSLFSHCSECKCMGFRPAQTEKEDSDDDESGLFLVFTVWNVILFQTDYHLVREVDMTDSCRPSFILVISKLKQGFQLRFTLLVSGVILKIVVDPLPERSRRSVNELRFKVIGNNLDAFQDRQIMAWLLQLQTLFSVQLPKMPKEYITRLVFDDRHKSMERLFIADLVRMFANCYRFNGVETEYYRCGYKLNQAAFQLVSQQFPDSDLLPHLPDQKPTTIIVFDLAWYANIS